MYFNELLNYNPNDPQSKSTKTETVDVQLAAATLMFNVIESDGETHRMEVAHMIEILKSHFSLSSYEISELFESARERSNTEPELENLTQQLCQALNAKERKQLLNDFWQIATADKKIHSGERQMIDKIANKLGLDAKEIVKARYNAEQRLELNIA